MTLGEVVKKYREEHALSMDEFAAKSGLSKGYISMLEANRNPRSKKPIAPSLETVRQVAAAIGEDAGALIRTLDGLEPPGEDMLVALSSPAGYDQLTDGEKQEIEQIVQIYLKRRGTK